MAEEVPCSDGFTGKRMRQMISVPFCWEEKPGMPKKNWRPVTPQAKPTAPPVKLIASVPFQWEEKPGTPLPCFLERSMLTLPAPESNVFLVSSPSHPPVDGNSWDGLNGRNGDETEIQESYSGMSESETDDSFRSANSLMANGLIPTMALSSAVPFEKQYLESVRSGHQASAPASPASETDSDVSSYATGPTSLVGASLLERLFPLLTPRSCFLGKVGCSETGVSNVQVTNPSRDLNHGEKGTASIKRPLTLGELIMMSRRQSYHRKFIKLQRQNLPKEAMKWRSFGHCIFGTSRILRKLHMNWKRHLQLKLM